MERNTEFFKVQLESENEFHSCSQKKWCCRWTFIKSKNWLISKNYFILSSWNNEISCKVKVTGKTGSIGNGEGLQIPCRLHFTGDVKYISKSKNILATLLWIIFFFMFSHFLIINGRKFELKSIFCPKDRKYCPI